MRKKRTSWNKGLKKETDIRVKRSAKKLSHTKKGKLITKRETRFCLCGCGESKIVRVTEKWKYVVGHHKRGKPSFFLGKHHSIRSKHLIGFKRKGKHTLNKDRHDDVIIICLYCKKKKKVKYKKRYDKYCSRICADYARIVKKEIRFCKCGCNETFICKVTHGKRFIFGHGCRNRHLSKEHKEKLKIKSNRDWCIEKAMKATCRRPNKFEVRALNYLNIIYENKFKYTGNGSLIINCRSADAYSKKLNTIALFHGIYWHLKRYGLEITEENKRSAEKIDSLPFISAGYKVIFIWEDELDGLFNNINLEKKHESTCT